MTINVFVMIGNSDNKLGQEEWSWFIGEIVSTLRSYTSITVLGEFYSLPNIKYQNACWHIGISDDCPFDEIKRDLFDLSKGYKQDSIAWIECKETEFIG